MPIIFFLNNDSSAEFAVHGDACIGRLLREYIGESDRRALDNNAFQPMLNANRQINIVDFSRVDNVNNGAWGYFISLFAALGRQGGRLRVCGLRDGALTGYNNTKTGIVLPRYATFADAILSRGILSEPEAEIRQTAIIERLIQERDNEG